MPRSEYRSDYSPPRRGATRVTEYEDDIEIRERRERRGPRERDYLRDAYERADDRGGTLVVREEIDERSTRGGRRDRERREEEEEVIISRSGGGRRDRPRRREVIEEEEDIRIRERDRDGSVSERIVLEDEVKTRRRDRPVEREEIREEVVYRSRRDRPYEREQITEEWIHVPRERPPVAREVEEWRFGPRRRPRSANFESITIKERERERPREEFREEDITIREREREREPARDYHEEEIRIRERDRPREEEIIIREREREREPARDYREEEIRIRERERPREEEIVIREREREREPARDYREEEIRIRERERPREEEIIIRERERERPREEEIIIRERERERERPREEEIIIRERERDRGSDSRDEEIRITERDRRGPGYRDEEIRIRERERESEWRERTRVSERDDGRGSNGSDHTRKEHRDSFKEEVIIRRDDRDGPGGRMDELVIRRKERSPSPEPIPVPAPIPPEPEPIRAPPIHQEIITHHRHIDHGFEPYRPPVSAPPRIRTPSPPSPVSPPKSTYEEIAIRHRDRDGRHEDDIVIKTKESRDDPRPTPSRRRSVSVDAISRRAPPQIDDEADYYARKTAERAYIGEAYNGATEDWAIVDVPPGTNRVVMDGVGGASEEVTWQRYNGVRRSRFVPEPEPAPERKREIEREVEIKERRRYVSERPKTDTMWTEITKDLVLKEAIEGFGYEYEETEWFFYVMEYLRYEDVRRLVRASDDIRARRRERVRQIEWESKMPREPERLPPRPLLAERPWGEERERIVEREWYDRRSPRPVIMPAPLSPPRIIEKDKVVVIRNER